MSLSLEKSTVLSGKELVARVIVISAISIMLVDTVYMNITGIGYGHKEQCVLYNFMPHWLFLVYEHFIELFMVVLLGIFGGVLIELYTKKVKRFFPKNQLLAFIYASFLPVCSCSVIPVIETMKERVSLKTLVTFTIAAPLLNPYIIMVSFSVLGVRYAVVRIVISFLLAILTGIIVELVANKLNVQMKGFYDHCKSGCDVNLTSPFRKTVFYMKKILPYVFVAGLMTLSFEYFSPQRYLETLSFSKEPQSTAVMLLVGIPIYVCNGADVLFLKPLLDFTDLSMASAMAFSLSSSAICISSIVMLINFFGRRLSVIIIGTLICCIIFLVSIVNLMVFF